MKLIRKIYLLLLVAFFVLFSKIENARSGTVIDTMKENIKKLGSPLSVKDPESVVAALITSLLAFTGVIFFILVIYGGFLWMTAKGNEDQINKAKKILMSSAIGLAIVMGAYIITVVVVELIESAGTVK